MIDTTAPRRQPKEKPLRIKRGHRKPSAFPNLEAPSSVNAATPGSTTFISQNRLVHSPSSDAFSAQPGDAGKTNGAHKGAGPKKPGSAFSLFCDDTRPSVVKDAEDKAKDGDDDATAAAAVSEDSVEEELSTRWKALPESERDDYQSRADQQMAEYEKEKEAYDAAVAAAKAKEQEEEEEEEAAAAKAKEADEGSKAAESAAEAEKGEEEEERASPRPSQSQTQPEDVEMTNYDTDQETQGEKPEE